MQRGSQARPAPDAQEAWARATLDKLQAQLALLPRPAKLRKALTRLSALTLSADLLADSRLSKALRRLRDYQQLATLAAHLLDRWSPLLDAQAQAERSQPSPGKHQGQKRSREARAGDCSQPEPTAPRLDTRGAAEPAAQGPQRTVPPLRIQLSRLPSGPRAAGSPDDCPRGHADSESQTPARLTWEECLDSQLPPRKKKKRTKSARAGQEPRTQHAQGTSGRDAWALEAAAGPPPRREDRQPSAHDDPQLATALSDSLTCWPDPPCPMGDAGEVPLPHWDWMSFGQPSPPRQQEPDLAPCRVNAKTCVFAGSRRARAPAVPSLRQLCTRLLRNHLDAIGPLPRAAPYSLLEPVLRSCSPDQLYRIETCNPGLVPHADSLWKAHCAQKFATDAPTQGETWRDAYLRLQLAGEQRLQALTLHFGSARLNKLQDARTKVTVFHGPTTEPSPLLKRPHGDPGEAIREETPTRSAPAPTDCKRAPRSNPGTSLTPTGPRKAPSAIPYPATAQRMQGSGKRELKKPMAPLMAKSIKDCRTLLSRRY